MGVLLKASPLVWVRFFHKSSPTHGCVFLESAPLGGCKKVFRKVASFHGCVHVVHKHSPPAHLRSWPLTVIRLVLPPKGELGNNKQNWGIATNNRAAQKRLEKIMGETPQGIAHQTTPNTFIFVKRYWRGLFWEQLGLAWTRINYENVARSPPWSVHSGNIIIHKSVLGHLRSLQLQNGLTRGFGTVGPSRVIAWTIL